MALPFLGADEVPDSGQGVQVTRVFPGTAAEKFGIKSGDFIRKIDELSVVGAGGREKLQEYVGGKFAGDKIEVHLERDGEPLKIALELMKRPLDPNQLYLNPRSPLAVPEEELREREYEKWLRNRKKQLDPSR